MTDPETDDQLVGTVVDGRFRLERLLGKGGMGRVYVATQLSVERKVAIKVLRPEISDAVSEARFFREAKTIASVRHPNIVGIIDFGHDAGIDAHYIAMEFVDGLPLSSLLKRGRLPLALVLHVARQICSGLSEAHAAGIVHRDLKPDNVLLERTAEGVVTARLVDFGIALPTGEESRFTSTGAVVGTPHYMAPEQAQDEAIDGRADLHALGVMLYEMLTGRLPWVADTPMAVLLKVVTDPPPPLHQSLPGEAMPPESVRDFVDSLLAKSPDERPADAFSAGQRLAAMASDCDALETFPSLEALEAVVVPRETDELALGETLESPAAGEPAFSPSSPQPDPSPEPRPTPDEARGHTGGESRFPTAIAAIVGALIVLGSVAAWFWQSDAPPRGDSEQTLPRQTPPPNSQAESGEAKADDGAVAEAIEAAHVALRAAAHQATETDRQPPEPTDPPAAAGKRPDPPEERREPAEKTPRPTKPPAPTMTPPTDEAFLNAKIIRKGGFCPYETCRFSPEATSAVCRGDSECSFDCARGDCLQQCEEDATCRYDCSEGRCKQFCAGDSTCEVTCAGGDCVQYCQDSATCTFSCAGGGCDERRFDDATIE